MGKFETYPEATTLENSDITLYNKSSITHKVTFGRLVNLIKSKIAESGLITSINTGAGLTGGEITSSGTIKCKLKSEVPSSLASVSVSTTADRQYPVNLDRDGNLSVNVPWAGDTYIGEKGVTVANNKISATLKNNTPSSLSSASMGSTADRQYAVGLDIDGKLSVNIPWTDTVGMTTNGSNADSHVNFAGAFTVGSRLENSTIGVNSTAEGSNTTASANCSHAEGYSTKANGDYSHAEGQSTEAKGNCSHAEGRNVKANGNYSHAEGHYSNADGDSSHAEGWNSHAYGNYSHAEGEGTARGECSHAEGYGTIARGSHSHAEGYYTEANGSSSSVKGYGKRDFYYRSDISELDTTVNSTISANGRGSSAEGYTEYWKDTQYDLEGSSIIQANGRGSHAEGCAVVDLQAEADSMIIAYGDGSHAEGYSNGESIILASGLGSHAEGGNTTAIGDYSHAEGYSTTASAPQSHAEGYSTTASGDSSHAEGCRTAARGHYSHAEGYGTEATYDYSHASGYTVEAVSTSQFVHGGYNAKFNTSSYGRGVFGFQPNGRYYSSNTSFGVSKGTGATFLGGVTATVSLAQCAIYTLYVSTHHTDNTCDISMFTIATPKSTTNTSIPSVETLLLHDVTVQGVENSKITISSEYDYMFHLIRII